MGYVVSVFADYGHSVNLNLALIARIIMIIY